MLGSHLSFGLVISSKAASYWVLCAGPGMLDHEQGKCRTGTILPFETFPSRRNKCCLSSLPLLSAGDVVDIYQREFLALRDRLHAAEQESLKRSKELNLVLDEIKRAISEKQALRDINRTWSSLSGE